MKSLSGSRWRIPAKQHNSRFGVTLAAVFALFSAGGPAAYASWLEDTRALMGTEVRVLLWHDDAVAGAAALNAAFDEIARIERVMSTYRDDSQISAVNRDAAVRPVVVNLELFDLIERARDVSVLTHGAFDITFDSVGQLYDFRKGVRPQEELLREALPAINYQLIEMSREDLSLKFLRDGVRINLGGIAKGYAVEEGVRVLREHGVSNAIVAAGGDSRLLGDRRGQPWLVGVRDPREEGRIVLRIPLDDEAVSTSGDYERFFIEGDTRYHHILVPATGKPATGLQSVTVIGPDGVLTDALSTSVFVMGVERGLQLISTLPDYEAIVIDANGELIYTSGLSPQH